MGPALGTLWPGRAGHSTPGRSSGTHRSSNAVRFLGQFGGETCVCVFSPTIPSTQQW